MKVCIFAGSGFSKAIFKQEIQDEFCKDFLNSAESKIFINYLPKELIDLLSDIQDVEIVMSHYFNLAYPSMQYIMDDRQRAKRNIKEIVFFRMALAIYFREKFAPKFLKEYEHNYKILLNRYFKKLRAEFPELSIITTNYDLGFEKIVEDVFDCGAFYYPGFDNAIEKNSNIPILKLHGSINWLEDRGIATNLLFKNNTRHVRKKKILNDLNVNPLCYDYDGTKRFTLTYERKKYTPILIPFFFQKTEKVNAQWWGKMFNEIWKQAYNKLVQADKLLFWGYGLPPADHHMFSFLCDIFEKTKADCDVVDKGPNDSNLIKLLNSVYGRKKAANMKIFRDGIVEYLQQELSGSM